MSGDDNQKCFHDCSCIDCPDCECVDEPEQESTTPCSESSSEFPVIGSPRNRMLGIVRQCRTCHHKQPSPISGIMCGLSGLIMPKNGACGMWSLGKGGF